MDGLQPGEGRGGRGRADVCMYGKHKWTLGFCCCCLFILKKNTKLRCGEFGDIDERTLGEVLRMIVFKTPSLNLSKN